MGRKVFLADKTTNHINTGGATIGTSPVALSSNDRNLSGGVQVLADAGNSDSVYVGVRSNLTAGSANDTDGFPLAAGEALFLPVQKESALYLIAGAADQGIHFVSF